MSESADMRIEDLNGEIVVLDTAASVVHRISGETAEAVRAETDPVSRRRIIQAAVALGVAAGVSTLALPSAAAAASGVPAEPKVGDNYTGYAGDAGVAAPTNVVATAGVSQVTVSWTGVSGATGYRVYVKPTSGNTYVLAWIGSATSTTIGSLTNGTSYDFIVVTVKNTQSSAQSTKATATPVDTPPGVPTNLAIVGDGFRTYTASWSAGTGATPTGYDVVYKLQDPRNGQVNSYGPVAVAGTSWTLSGIESEYFAFQVRAKTATQTSPYSIFKENFPL